MPRNRLVVWQWSNSSPLFVPDKQRETSGRRLTRINNQDQRGVKSNGQEHSEETGDDQKQRDVSSDEPSVKISDDLARKTYTLRTTRKFDNRTFSSSNLFELMTNRPSP